MCPLALELRREREREYQRNRRANDPEYREYERERRRSPKYREYDRERYWNMSGVRYNAELLRQRRWKALKRMAKRNARED